MLSKIAFLFLTVGNIYHEQQWVDFFTGHEQQYSVYVHCKNNISDNSFFKPFQISKKIDTTWANTMRAQIALLEAALADEQNEKFIYVSESTIPLQPFPFAYETLMANSLSMFGFSKSRAEARKFGIYRKNRVYKNGQWVVLNRKHAQMMVKDQSIIKEFVKGIIDNEHYPSTFLSLHNELKNVEKKNTTLVIWDKTSKNHPHTFENLAKDRYTARLIAAIKNKTFLFARKFSKNCDLRLVKNAISEQLKISEPQKYDLN